MNLDSKYQTEDLFNISCPYCNDEFESVFGKDSSGELEFPRDYADKLKNYRICFALCNACQISIYFEKKNNSRLFFVSKHHYELLEINYASTFNICRDRENKDRVHIQDMSGEELERKKISSLDKTFFRYLEKLKLLRD